MKRRGLYATGILSCALVLLASCSTSPPKIAQTFWQLNLVRTPATGRTHESLSLFVHVTDSNGVSDLDSIYLLSDSKELYWRLDPSNWQSSDKNGELWVGSNSIEMPDRSPMPRGKYRILLSNLAGERVSDDIYVSADKLNAGKTPFPELSVSDGSAVVGGNIPGVSLWIYNPIGQLVGQRTRSGRYPISSLEPPNNRNAALTLYVYAYDKSCGCGLVSGPYSTAP